MTERNQQLDEYLRRNLLHAKAVGAAAGVLSIIGRLEARTRLPPQWLLDGLRDVFERADAVATEMAVHRDEVKP